MGISVYYNYKIKTNPDGARRLMEQLHAAVSKLPFDNCTPVYELRPPDGKLYFEEGDPDHFIKPGDVYLDRKRRDGTEEMVRVEPLHSIFFFAVGRGSEPIIFGLASHPAVIRHRESVEEDDTIYMGAGDEVEFETGLEGWYSWWGAVKTQYAGDPKLGGEANFVRIHTAIFRAAEECRKLGMEVEISDDVGNGEHRDEKKLAAELHRWDALIAGFVGQVSDEVGAGEVVAPIKERADYEPLEAKGQEGAEEV